jgi:hypothetical protein
MTDICKHITTSSLLINLIAALIAFMFGFAPYGMLTGQHQHFLLFAWLLVGLARTVHTYLYMVFLAGKLPYTRSYTGLANPSY